MIQRIIGVTGGIATGKTTITNYLHHHYQLTILDADLYAREALNAERLQLIQERYGSQILTKEGSLDRQRLGAIIFDDEKERRWLETLIHPYVTNRLQLAAQELFPNPVIMAIPLLFEANLQHLVTEIWVVTCTPELQQQRLCQRNNLTIIEAQQRVAAQMPLKEKIMQADIVFDNSGDLVHLWQQIDQVMAQAIALQ
ncbi:MAG: dephospho-CoA kinase [Pseudanabaena sp. ELA607]